MSVPNTNTFSLWDVCNEIYSSHSAGMNLTQCFVDATGTFDPSYMNNEDNGLRQLSEFRNYSHKLALVYDYDGNPYQPIRIGNQVWLNSDFHCTHFADGTEVPFKTSVSQGSSDFNNASVAYTRVLYGGSTYGYEKSFYYNAGAAFMTHQLAIPGWHIPTLNDLDILASNLGGGSVAGGHLKYNLAPNNTWNNPNTGADNSSGFTAQAYGMINNVAFNFYGQNMYFWTSEYPVNGIYKAGLLSYNSAALNSTNVLANYGLSVRLIKD